MDKNQYFSIPHRTNINIEPLAADAQTDMEQLINEMPPLFLVASDITPLDGSVLRALNHVGDKAEGLVNYLHHQNRKIDAILGFMLNQLDDPATRYQTTSIGASNLIFHSDTPFDVSTIVRLKVFLPEESLAIYCFAKVDNCKQADDGYHVALTYHTLREEDEEALIKATLHLQTHLLKKQAAKRKNAQEVGS